MSTDSPLLSGCTTRQAGAKETNGTQYWLGSMKDSLNSTYPVALQATFWHTDQKWTPKVSRALPLSDTKPTALLVLMQNINMLCTYLANIHLCTHRCQVWNCIHSFLSFNSRSKGNNPVFTNAYKIMLLQDSGASCPPKYLPKGSKNRCWAANQPKKQTTSVRRGGKQD